MSDAGMGGYLEEYASISPSLRRWMEQYPIFQHRNHPFLRGCLPGVGIHREMMNDVVLIESILKDLRSVERLKDA